jgi:hypothetical protein
MTWASPSPFVAGQIIEITFGTFTPRITIHSERELKVDVIAGAYEGFSDTVMYEAVAIRGDLIILSWREHNGSTIVHALDLTSRVTHCAITPAAGDFQRLIGRIEIKAE